MATRFIPKSDFVCADRKGRRRMYKQKHRRGDGSPGYLADEIKDLYRDHLTMFKQIEITGGDVVEQATAAPGEKRATRGFQCDQCEFVAKTAAGLGSHQRVHEEN